MKAMIDTPTKVLRTAMTFTILGMGAGNAQAAAVDYFLQIDGIKGESSDSRHKDWIDIDSFSWGISNPGSVGSGGGGSAGRTVFSPFSWTQQLDMSVPPMFLGVASGKHFQNATLDVQQAGEQSSVFFQMRFDDVLLTKLNINGANNLPSVAAALNYSKITMTYRPQRPDGSLGAPIVGGWDLKSNKSAAFFGSADVLSGLFLAGPTPSAVPAPATVWLFASGLLGLFGIVRRSAGR